MNNDDIPAEQADDPSTTDTTETAADGGSVATEAPQSRFWGVAPSEWELVEGSEVYDVNPSYTPEEEEVTYIEMDALDTELPFPKYTKKRRAADYSGKLFREGDTLFARITPCTENGKAAFVDEMETDVGIGSTEYAVLSPDRERIHPLYLYYVSKSHPVRNYAISRMRGSTGRQRVPFDVFRRELDISLPPIEEQKKIVSILYNIDLLVDKTDDLIEKTKRFRKGYIEDRVLGKHVEGPRKEGSIGTRRVTVPERWDVARVEDIADIVSGNSFPTKYQDGDSGPYPVIRVEDMNLTGNDKFIKTVENSVTESVLQELNKDLYPPGTVIHPRVGEALRLNKTRITDIESAFDDNIMGWVPNDEVVPEFLYYASTLIDFNSIAQGGTVPSINKMMAGSFQVPLPSKSEQQEIADDMSNMDGLVAKYKLERSKLLEVKRGLLQDLLTGDVRTADVQLEQLKEMIKHD